MDTDETGRKFGWCPQHNLPSCKEKNVQKSKICGVTQTREREREPFRLQSMGSHGIGHNLVTEQQK